MLAQILLVDIEAGLNGIDDFASGKGPDDIPVVEIELGLCRVLVGVHGDEFPVIFPRPFEFPESLLDGDDLQSLLFRMGVDHGRVHLDVGARPAAFGGVHSRLDHP